MKNLIKGLTLLELNARRTLSRLLEYAFQMRFWDYKQFFLISQQNILIGI